MPRDHPSTGEHVAPLHVPGQIGISPGTKLEEPHGWAAPAAEASRPDSVFVDAWISFLGGSVTRGYVLPPRNLNIDTNNDGF